MSKAVLASLRATQSGLETASRRYGPLYHEQVYNSAHQGMTFQMDDAERVVERSQADPPDHGWQEWHGPCKAASGSSDPDYSGPDGEWYGRFYGDPAGLDEFKRWADAAYLAVVGTGQNLHVGSTGWEGFLELLYRIAEEFPTPLLAAEEGCRFWTDGGWSEFPHSQWTGVLDESGRPVGPPEPPPDEADPPRPTVRSLRLNVFAAASALVQMILDPETALLAQAKPFRDYLVEAIPFVPPEPKAVGGEPGTSAAGGTAAMGDSPAAVDTSAPMPDASRPVNNGDYVFAFDPAEKRWNVRFRYGDQPDDVLAFSFRKLEGFRHIAFMLKREKRAVPCLEIIPKDSPPSSGGSLLDREDYAESSADDSEQGGDFGGEEDVTDDESLRNYRAAIERLRRDLREAERKKDLAKQQRIKGDVAAIKERIRKDVDLSGRPRKVRASKAEHRAATSVRNRLDAAKAEVVKAAGRVEGRQRDGLMALGRYLDHIKVQGKDCVNLADENLSWHVLLP